MANDGIQSDIKLREAAEVAFSQLTAKVEPLRVSAGPGIAAEGSRVGYDLITDATGNRYLLALDHETNTMNVYRGDDRGGFQRVVVEDHGWERTGSKPAHQIILADGTTINTGNAAGGPTIDGKPAAIATRGTMMEGVQTGIVIDPQTAGQIISGADNIEPLYIKQAPKFDLAGVTPP